MKKSISKLFQKKKCYLPKYSFEELQELHSVDDALKPTLQRANSGSISAMYDIYKYFAKESEANKDWDIASYYLLAIINNLELKTNDDVKLMISVLLDYALAEKERNNYEYMNKAFYDLTLLTVKNIPMEEWDFSIFDIIKEFVQKQ